MRASQAAELYRRVGRPVPRELEEPGAEKIRNTRRKVVDGISFRSTLEADVYQLLSLWQRAGEITELRCQELFLLQPKQPGLRAITYRADFTYVRRDGRRVVIDAKGYRMEVYRIKRKMFIARYPEIEFQEWTRETLRDMRGR